MMWLIFSKDVKEMAIQWLYLQNTWVWKCLLISGLSTSAVIQSLYLVLYLLNFRLIQVKGEAC